MSSSVILFESYAGSSSGFIFRVSCNGRRLSLEEVKKLGFVSDETLKRHKQSDWGFDWYEVHPGDQITVMSFDENTGDDLDTVFVVPASGLEKPPQDLDATNHLGLYEYLEERCEQKR